MGIGVAGCSGAPSPASTDTGASTEPTTSTTTEASAPSATKTWDVTVDGQPAQITTDVHGPMPYATTVRSGDLSWDLSACPAGDRAAVFAVTVSGSPSPAGYRTGLVVVGADSLDHRDDRIKSYVDGAQACSDGVDRRTPRRGDTLSMTPYAFAGTDPSSGEIKGRDTAKLIVVEDYLTEDGVPGPAAERILGSISLHLVANGPEGDYADPGEIVADRPGFEITRDGLLLDGSEVRL